MKKILAILGGVLLSLSIGGNASAFTFSPSMREYIAEPGNKITETLRVYNETEVEQTFYPVFQDFAANNDESGSPAFVPEGQFAKTGSLASWFGKLEPIKLAPKARSEIVFVINVPKDAEPGGHYGAILFQDHKPDENTNIGVGAKTGPIILVNVLGDIKDEMALLEFGSDKSFYSAIPVNFSMRLKNDGTVHQTPTGKLIIKGLWPKQTEIKFNDKRLSHVLPGSVRKLTTSWTGTDAGPGFVGSLKNEINNLAFGKFTAEIQLDYGVVKDGKVAAQASFWVFPWHLALVIFLGLTILVSIIKMYNKAIIARAKRA